MLRLRVTMFVLSLSLLFPLAVRLVGQVSTSAYSAAQSGSTINVDNNLSNRTATGSITNQSDWPMGLAHIENNKTFWLRVFVLDTTGDVFGFI